MQDSTATPTFLFTDIEGSTSLWEAQPELMAQAVARHDTVLREAVQGHAGRIVKTTGDGIYAVFGTPADALASVIAIQLGLRDAGATAGLALKVRCGLHTGAAHQRDNDYFGTTINRTARIMGAAHGEQILVSRAVAEAVQDGLADGVTLLDLGSVRLKGLSTAEAVFQVVHPQLRKEFPALRELEATPNNLPQQLTSFIGRERERDEIEDMLEGTRLLTLLGMGGLGKTRLALQVGTSVMDAYPDGVWFVDLQTIRDEGLVASETARVLGVREEPGRPLVQTLTAHLKTRKLMLIVDNCEQVIDACAQLSSAILKAAPEVRMLATSRIALRVPGEQTYVVQPLPVPTRNQGFEALQKSTAVQLFVERAKLHKPAFALTEKEAPAVADLVYRLEGIPLALELAAARVRSLSVADINKRLNDRYKLLTGGDRTLQARQQTLRALVDWSYDLLEDNEQALLARLSVFAGSFALEAAEMICGADPLDPVDVLDLITSLVEKSLLRVEESDDGARYRMLETIREYATEKLTLRDELTATRVAHCDYFLAFAKASRRGMEGSEQAEWIRRIEQAHDDLRSAISLTLSGGADPVLAVKFVVALMGFWILRGYSTEGRNYVRTALALPAVQASDLARAHALYIGATLADAQSNYAEAAQMLEQCIALRRALDSRVDLAAALSTASMVRLHIGEAAAARDLESEAVAIFREIGNPIGESIGLLHLGQIDAYVGNDADARSNFEKSLKIASGLEYFEVASECELMLGQLAMRAGDEAHARGHFSRGLEVSRKAEDKRNEASALWWLGAVDLRHGELAAAQVRLGAALRAFVASEMFSELLGCLEDHAVLLGALDRPDDAVRVCAAVDAARERLALPRAPREVSRWDDLLAGLRGAVEPGRFEQIRRDGFDLELRDAVAFVQTQRVAEAATV